MAESWTVLGGLAEYGSKFDWTTVPSTGCVFLEVEQCLTNNRLHPYPNVRFDNKLFKTHHAAHNFLGPCRNKSMGL